jgi:hypothetical protein
VDSLARAVEAADSGWAVLAIAIIGVYVLVWKFGGQILGIVKENNSVAKSLQESIITNHGSKNIGDAIDKLTEALGALRQDFDLHIVQEGEVLAGIKAQLTAQDEKAASTRTESNDQMDRIEGGQ